MKSGNIGSFPVIENEHKRTLVGIVTGRGLDLKIVTEGLDANSAKAVSVTIRQVIACRAKDLAGWR
jgi:CBS domain-containing protein